MPNEIFTKNCWENYGISNIGEVSETIKMLRKACIKILRNDSYLTEGWLYTNIFTILNILFTFEFCYTRKGKLLSTVL